MNRTLIELAAEWAAGELGLGKPTVVWEEAVRESDGAVGWVPDPDWLVIHMVDDPACYMDDATPNERELAAVHTVWHEVGHLLAPEVFPTLPHWHRWEAKVEGFGTHPAEVFAEAVAHVLQERAQGKVTTWRYGLTAPLLEGLLPIVSKLIAAPRLTRR